MDVIKRMRDTLFPPPLPEQPDPRKEAERLERERIERERAEDAALAQADLEAEHATLLRARSRTESQDQRLLRLDAEITRRQQAADYQRRVAEIGRRRDAENAVERAKDELAALMMTPAVKAKILALAAAEYAMQRRFCTGTNPYASAERATWMYARLGEIGQRLGPTFLGAPPAVLPDINDSTPQPTARGKRGA